MGVESQGDVLGTAAVGHDRHRLGDHVRGPRADDVDAENPAGFIRNKVNRFLGCTDDSQTNGPTGLGCAGNSLSRAIYVKDTESRYVLVNRAMAAGVDIISRGRLTFGFGAGWYYQEYGQYGYVFPEKPALRIGHPFLNFGKIDLNLGISHVTYQRAQDTMHGFEVPADTFILTPGIEARYDRWGYSVAGYYDHGMRTTWRPWSMRRSARQPWI